MDVAGSIVVKTAAIAVIVLGIAAPVAAQDPPAKPPAAQAADPLMFKHEAVLLYNQVKPDKTADFEASWATIKAGLAKNEKPELKELGESLKIFRIDAPPADPAKPSVLYIFILNPPSKTQTYDPTKILYSSGAFSREEAEAIFGKLKDCYAGPINTVPLVKAGGLWPDQTIPAVR